MKIIIKSAVIAIVYLTIGSFALPNRELATNLQQHELELQVLALKDLDLKIKDVVDLTIPEHEDEKPRLGFKVEIGGDETSASAGDESDDGSSTVRQQQ